MRSDSPPARRGVRFMPTRVEIRKDAVADARRFSDDHRVALPGRQSGPQWTRSTTSTTTLRMPTSGTSSSETGSGLAWVFVNPKEQVLRIYRGGLFQLIHLPA